MAYSDNMNIITAIYTAEQSRKEALTDEVNGFIIDTCFTYDTNKYETGITRDNDKWFIVEYYETKELAEIGHRNWVKKCSDDPNLELKHCEDY
jgi:hypothetical protein